jgi:foldase protein PrsA
MKKLVVLTALGALILGGCAELFDPAAAVVGTDKITVDEVNEGLEQFVETQEYERLAAQGDSDAIKREFEQAFLSQEIRKAIMAPEAERREIEVGEDEVNERIDEIQNDFPSQGAFEEALREQGITPEQLEELVFQSVLEEKLRAEVTEESGPTEEDLETFYDENIDEFTETRAQHILVDEQALAAEIAQQLQAAPEGRLDGLFAQLARRYSTDDSNANNGGDLGFFSRRSGFADRFVATAEDLAIGQVSDPVQTQFGYHVIRVTDRRVPPFERVSEQIAEQLGADTEEEVWQEWLRSAYARADIRVNSRYGELDLETQQVVDPSAETIPGAEEPAPSPTAS